MEARFPYNLPSRQALCVEVRKLSKYKNIEDNLVTFEDIYFSPTAVTPGRTFIEMVDLQNNIKSWFTYRRLDLNIALSGSNVITLTGKVTSRNIVKEINRAFDMTFMEDDVEMSDDVLHLTDNVYTLKALMGSYAYYGKVDITIRHPQIQDNARLLEDGSARLLEDGTVRLLEWA